MKFINYIESISGVSIFGLISLLLFTGFFSLMLVWTLKADKRLIEEISHIPLDPEQNH
ncbi:CcoQ/FixQ family Cbb3-type cytochrome c oxidase assembly chaperone [Parasegetibacter sp. NRK P23]|uniref:CcoQ/FixQ family Cbb3-type cytochrome c oxidase assembly chaperone n=1 Tax=Parasegetibacter sp. NRK P23 TaxID=2942999 RepID=UPI0020445E07|nr:CcoQ/FixQ family Cbb3-type cytochrome c oxidase assembly chaperone [Parasegetibacter sp. NRK P23]MCM5529516.1 CcoQ/FixQ family Cbb3-type cytochrome c oxidase assembly chaperone [Parasegetibacter sp. NRK P23]